MFAIEKAKTNAEAEQKSQWIGDSDGKMGELSHTQMRLVAEKAKEKFLKQRNRLLKLEANVR